MLRYKIDVLEELKEKGYNTTRLRKEKILSESTIQRLREGKTSVSCDSIGTICSVLGCQPDYILENIMTDEEKINFVEKSVDFTPEWV